MKFTPADRVMIGAASWIAVNPMREPENLKMMQGMLRDALPFVSRSDALISKMADLAEALLDSRRGPDLSHARFLFCCVLADFQRRQAGDAYDAFRNTIERRAG